ncbi:MAG: hypothetical protein WBA74_18310, partial [Cyclobacteriaceae bacterium]
NESGSIGMLKRQCTQEYKIDQVHKAIRKAYRLKRYQRAPKTEIWLGITIEEAARMKYPAHKWQVHVYPFCNYKGEDGQSIKLSFQTMSRADCTSWLKKHGFPIPGKSACFFCPYQSDARWLAMKKDRPLEWHSAVKLDKRIRNSSQKGVNQPIYLHKDCVPLDQVKLSENQTNLFNGECDGLCGV